MHTIVCLLCSTTDVFLGKGAFGNVYKVINTESGEVFAMKVLDKKRLLRKRIGKDSNALQKVKMEIAVWKRLIHPNCLTLLEVIEGLLLFIATPEILL
jgi:serine/threonine protein kinase